MNLRDEVQLAVAQLRTTLNDPAATMKWSLVVNQVTDSLDKAVAAYCDHIFVVPPGPADGLPGACQHGCGTTWEQHMETATAPTVHLEQIAQAKAGVATLLAEAREQGREEVSGDDQRVKELETLVAQQQFDLEAGRKVEQAWRAEADELRTQVRVLVAKLEGQDDSATREHQAYLERELKSLRDTYTTVTDACNDALNKRDEYKRDLDEATILLAAANREVRELRERLDNQRTTIRGHQERERNLREELEAARVALKEQLVISAKQATVNRFLVGHDRTGADHAMHAAYMERARDTAAGNAKEWAAKARQNERRAEAYMEQLTHERSAQWMARLDPKTQQEFFTELTAVAQKTELHPLEHLKQVHDVITRYRSAAPAPEAEA